MTESLLMHYTSLSKFQEIYYKDILTDNNLASEEVNFSKLTLTDEGEIKNFWGYIFLKDGVKYLLKSYDKDNNSIDLKELLPIKPKNTIKVSYKSEVYHLIQNYSSVKFRKEGRISFKECVRRLNVFETTNKEQRTLLILSLLTQYFDRVNVRYATEAGSGKDSVIDTLGLLLGKAHTVVGPTTPKLESLATTNKLIAINEVADLPQPKWAEIEQFLLDCGAFKPEITKRSRKFDNVGEFINITDVSLALFYNDIDHYPFSTRYIDEVTKMAVLDRFPAFRFWGVLTEDFNKINTTDVSLLVSNNIDWYKELIYSLEYWSDRKNEFYKEKGFDIDVDKPYAPRWKRNISTIFKFVAMFADTKEEFEYLKQKYYDAITEYRYMLDYKELCNEKWLLQNHKVFKDRVITLKQENQKQLNVLEMGD
jgi:hypothetical protein